MKWASKRSLPRGINRDERGTVAMEFALISPVFILMMLGSIQFGVAIKNLLMVENAVAEGARMFFMSRGVSTPYTSTQSVMNASATGLTLTITTTVGGTACSTDSACTALMTSGAQATVSASVPCNLVVLGVDFKPSCSLSSSVTGRVE